MPVEPLERLLGYVNVLVQLLLILKIRKAGLQSGFRWFQAWLVFEITRALVSLPLSYDSDPYAIIFFLCLPVAWVFYGLVVGEIYGRVLESYRGLARLSRASIGAAMIICGVVGAALIFPDLMVREDRYPLVVAALTANRWVVTSIALVLLALVMFVLWYPAPLRRNTVSHSLILTCYFLAESAGDLLRNQLGAGWGRPVSLLVVGLSAVCATAWLFALSQSGEREKVYIRGAPPPGFEDRILSHLGSLNSYLERSSRK